MKVDYKVNEIQAQSSILCTIDPANVAHAFNLLINTYASPLQSCLRELICNAQDAVIEKAQHLGESLDGILEKSPVVVTKRGIKAAGYIDIEDFGLGLSPERIETLYKSLGASSKRGSNSTVGGFGIGRFSALAYNNFMDIVSVYDGVEYRYQLVNNTVPEILPLGAIPTDKRNGTKVSIPIKPEHFQNIEDTVVSIVPLFKGVILNNFKVVLPKVIEFDNFYIVDSSYGIALGPVLYPNPSVIPKSYNQLKNYIKDIVLKFDIGELAVTPNREELISDKKLEQALENKAKLCINELTQKGTKVLETDENRALYMCLFNKAINYYNYPIQVKMDSVVNTISLKFDMRLADVQKIIINTFRFYSLEFKNYRNREKVWKRIDALNYDDLDKAAVKSSTTKFYKAKDALMKSKYILEIVTNMSYSDKEVKVVEEVANLFFLNKEEYDTLKGPKISKAPGYVKPVVKTVDPMITYSPGNGSFKQELESVLIGRNPFWCKHAEKDLYTPVPKELNIEIIVLADASTTLKLRNTLQHIDYFIGNNKAKIQELNEHHYCYNKKDSVHPTAAELYKRMSARLGITKAEYSYVSPRPSKFVEVGMSSNILEKIKFCALTETISKVSYISPFANCFQDDAEVLKEKKDMEDALLEQYKLNLSTMIKEVTTLIK